MTWQAPVKEVAFALELAGLEQLSQLEAYNYSDASPELAMAVLEEAGKFAAEELAPLNELGDRQGAGHSPEGGVSTPPGWRQAYQHFVEGGWGALAQDPDYGGQGLPNALAAAVSEFWSSANMAWALCPLLTQSAITALRKHGTKEQKNTYLPPLISGEWAGTMNLTETQAGSDLAALKTRADPEGDHYLIRGQKIFITYGEHDLSENIIHLVLARLPDAPAGVRGISLFLVPRYLLAEDGSWTRDNDVRALSIEHKLGINGSPTAVLAYGEKRGSAGWLVGGENNGLALMFTMMNLARHAVGVEGYAVAERSLQQAADFARERVQGKPVGARGSGPWPIIEHPDVKRMLALMRAQVEAARCLGIECAAEMDREQFGASEAERQRAGRSVDFLIPLVKGWSSEMGVEVCSLGIQVHGGMGYIEETGAAQHYRDVRITPIYEGTTGIQAKDLLGRKILANRGQTFGEFAETVAKVVGDLENSGNTDLRAQGRALEKALADARAGIAFVLEAEETVAAGASVSLLLELGILAGAWMMGRQSLLAERRLAEGAGDSGFYRARRASAAVFFSQVLPRARAFMQAATGAGTVLEFDADSL